jgi:hypothetical protein
MNNLDATQYISNIIADSTTNCIQSKLVTNKITNVGNGNLYNNITQSATGGYTSGCLAYPSNNLAFTNNVALYDVDANLSYTGNSPDNTNMTVNDFIKNYVTNNITMSAVDNCLTDLTDANIIQNYGNTDIFSNITQTSFAEVGMTCINSANQNVNNNNVVSDVTNQTFTTEPESLWEPLELMMNNILTILFIIVCIIIVAFVVYVNLTSRASQSSITS